MNIDTNESLLSSWQKAREEYRDRLLSSRYADIMRDASFKAVFNDESVLLYLVNACLGKGFAKGIIFSRTEMRNDSALGKVSFLDMAVKTEGKEGDVLVEVQVLGEDNFADRLIFYSSFLIQRKYQEYCSRVRRERILQAEKDRKESVGDSGSSDGRQPGELFNPASLGYVGGYDYEYSPVYVISFLGFDLARHTEDRKERNDDFARYFEIRDRKSGELFSDKLHFMIIEVKNMKKGPKELETDLERLTYAFGHMKEETHMPEEFKGTGMEKIYQKASIAQMPQDEYMNYINHCMAIWDEENRLNSAYRMGKREARKEEKVAIAKAAKDKGLDSSLISDLTGLPLEQIEKL